MNPKLNSGRGEEDEDEVDECQAEEAPRTPLLRGWNGFRDEEDEDAAAAAAKKAALAAFCAAAKPASSLSPAMAAEMQQAATIEGG